jgi:hypothetical protein
MMVLLPDQIDSVVCRWLSVPERKQLPELQVYRKWFPFQMAAKQYYFSNFEQNTILPRVPYSFICICIIWYIMWYMYSVIYQCFAVSCVILANVLTWSQRQHNSHETKFVKRCDFSYLPMANDLCDVYEHVTRDHATQTSSQGSFF